MPLTTTTPKPIIFTDLDGTLLDRQTYTFEPALPALRIIQEKGIPLILSSSKTRAEIEFYRKKLENEHPFISENGGAVFVPKGYFSFPFPYDRELDKYFVLELGFFYPVILEILESVKKETGIKITGFSDLAEEELSSLTGLSLEEALFAKRREYDEAFIVEGGEKEVERVKKKIEEKGMRYVWGGRFHHILGKNDKGKAVQIIKELYENKFFSISTVGIGDSMNDLPMLLIVDQPIFLNGEEDRSLAFPSEIHNVTIIEGTGPQAWNEVILRVISKLEN
jgi:mannosyl-3-phosphoglycerate phosphatase